MFVGFRAMLCQLNLCVVSSSVCVSLESRTLANSTRHTNGNRSNGFLENVAPRVYRIHIRKHFGEIKDAPRRQPLLGKVHDIMDVCVCVCVCTNMNRPHANKVIPPGEVRNSLICD